MDVIRSARWRELGLLRIIIYLNMLTYVSDTEISPQNNIIKIWRVDISLHQVFFNYSKFPLFSWNLTTAFLHIVSITDASPLVVNISKKAMTTCFSLFFDIVCRQNGRGGGRLCKFVSTSYSILLSREINLKAQSQYNVRAHERLPEKS